MTSGFQDSSFKAQQGARRNMAEYQDFLDSLDTWENQVKNTERKLINSKEAAVPTRSFNLPPVRNARPPKPKPTEQTASRLSGYDYRSWDKFDVDKALEDVDGDTEAVDNTDEVEVVDEAEWERKKQRELAEFERVRGNEAYKAGNWRAAVDSYTAGIECDPSVAALYGNRAMAYIKLSEFVLAESDCTNCLRLDPVNVKAYLRRGVARLRLNRVEAAKEDLQRVLKLEPNNRQATQELGKANRLLQREEEYRVRCAMPTGSEFVAVDKPEYMRSKKPLVRVAVQDVMDDSQSESPDQPPTIIELPDVSVPVSDDDESDSGDWKPVRITKPSTSVSARLDSSSREIKNVTDALKKGQPITGKQTGEFVEVDRALSEWLNKTPADNKQATNTQPIAKNVNSNPLKLPVTSAQFLAEVTRLKRNPEEFFNYIRSIPIDLLTKFCDLSLETDVLVSIMRIIQDYYLPNNIPCYQLLCRLSQTKRFSMAILFTDDRDKLLIRNVLSELNKRGFDVNKLSKSFSVTL